MAVLTGPSAGHLLCLAQQNVEAALAIARQHPLYRPDPQDGMSYLRAAGRPVSGARDYLAIVTNGVLHPPPCSSPTPQPNDRG